MTADLNNLMGNKIENTLYKFFDVYNKNYFDKKKIPFMNFVFLPKGK